MQIFKHQIRLTLSGPSVTSWLLLSFILEFFLSPSLVRASDAPPVTLSEPILFKETGHTLAYNFRQSWEQNGGLALFGYPLTEVFMENNLPVQYFERVRLEWHADLGLVQLGLLGNWVAANRRVENPFKPVTAPAPAVGPHYFKETGHNLSDKFSQYWQGNGGLAIFGFPISEEFLEKNHEDDHTYLVQYFERGRFEFHPEMPAGSQVLLGHLGRLYLEQQKNAPTWAVVPVDNPSAAWQALRPAHIRIRRLNLDTDVVEGGLNLQGWDVPRYTAVHYWPLAAFPGSKGNIIIAGHAGYKNTIFDQLPQAVIGDEVAVTVNGTDQLYRIATIQTVAPEDTAVLDPYAIEILTLITCVPPGLYDKRLIVRALPAKP